MDIPKTMRAVVYRGANDLRLEIIPVPQIKAGELLVKVAVCGVCPTDIKKIQSGLLAPPRIFGHETAGTIVKIGARVKNFHLGDRVALHHHVPCLRCHFCRHRAFAQCETYQRTGITAGFEPSGGGYAEYVRVMPFVLPGVVKIPRKNSWIEGAMLEPTNTILKAIHRLELLRGDSVLVIGQGPIGLMFTKILALRGMKVVASDLMETRLKFAKTFGANAVFKPEEFTAQRRGENETQNSKLQTANSSAPPLCVSAVKIAAFDAAVITVPSDAAVTMAEKSVRGGGQILLFAHTQRGVKSQFDFSTVCLDEKDFIGSYSSDITLQKEAAKLIFTRQLNVRLLITHQFPLEKTAEAIALAAHPSADSP